MTEPDRQLRLIDLLKSGFFIKSMRPLRVVGRIQQYGPISFFSYKSQQSVVQFLTGMMRLSLVGLIDEKLFKYSNIGATGHDTHGTDQLFSVLCYPEISPFAHVGQGATVIIVIPPESILKYQKLKYPPLPAVGWLSTVETLPVSLSHRYRLALFPSESL